MKKYLAEMIGTMVLVLMGCGSAVFAGSAAGAVSAGVGTLGVAFAFGLSVVAMAYAIGGISGCHINPAITLGVLLSGRMSGKMQPCIWCFRLLGRLSVLPFFMHWCLRALMVVLRLPVPMGLLTE